MGYKPSASLKNAVKRADMLKKIRRFFDDMGILEVDTPILSHAGVTDVYLQSVSANFFENGVSTKGYLHTSPEFAMKRLLAAWQVPIYQLAKVFRDNEIGNKHNIEFTMLEWYVPHSSLDSLIKTLNALINSLFETDTMFERVSYRQAFIDHAFIDPFTATINDFEQVAKHFGIETSLFAASQHVNVMSSTQKNEDKNQHSDTHKDEKKNSSYVKDKGRFSVYKNKKKRIQLHARNTKANATLLPLAHKKLSQQRPSIATRLNRRVFLETIKERKTPHTVALASLEKRVDSRTVNETKEAWLDLLYSHLVEPNLGHAVPTVIYDFPAEQASLAKIATDANGNLVAKRFELYIQGYEIANAYDELADAEEQRIRFELDNELRASKGLPEIPIDEHLLEALSDMPDSVGIAVGIDRLVMLACQTKAIADVICFTTPNS